MSQAPFSVPQGTSPLGGTPAGSDIVSNDSGTTNSTEQNGSRDHSQGYITDVQDSDINGVEEASENGQGLEESVNEEDQEEVSTEELERATQTIDSENTSVGVDIVQVEREQETSERQETQPDGPDQPAGRATRSKGPARPIQLGPRDIQVEVTAPAWRSGKPPTIDVPTRGDEEGNSEPRRLIGQRGSPLDEESPKTRVEVRKRLFTSPPLAPAELSRRKPADSTGTSDVATRRESELVERYVYDSPIYRAYQTLRSVRHSLGSRELEKAIRQVEVTENTTSGDSSVLEESRTQETEDNSERKN